MKLSDVKALLPKLETITFRLDDGSLVPGHFHVTEVGIVNKRFIDCGGTIREEKMINFQLWAAEDEDHRLHPSKLLAIIALSEQKLQMEDAEVEVEYQGSTIGKFRLDFDGQTFLLRNTTTNCLAPDRCGVPAVKPRIRLSDLQKGK